MELRAKVIQILGLTTGTSKAGKDWAKAEIIVENLEIPQYPKKVHLTNMKNAQEFAAVQVGMDYIFQISLESREFNGRWYTNIDCWSWRQAQ